MEAVSRYFKRLGVALLTGVVLTLFSVFLILVAIVGNFEIDTETKADKAEAE